MRFVQFLLEADEGEGANKHLTHIEDDVIDRGHDGAKHAINALYGVHDTLRGRKTRHSVSIKKDGAPAVFAGWKDGKFFVNTKSMLNKKPKFNFSAEDIDRNHGHAPGLVDKLKQAHEHLQKIVPADGRVYQGDLMYGSGDLKDEGKRLSFQANTIRYAAEKDSDAGQAMQKAKLGVAFHTSYPDSTPEGMSKPQFGFDARTFPRHPDVHVISPIMSGGGSRNYSPELRQNFHDAMSAVKSATAEAEEHHQHVEPHRAHMNMYINQTVRDSTTPSAAGYRSFLINRSEKDKKAASLIPHAQEHAGSIDKVLGLHKAVSNAKHALISVLDQHQHEFHHEIEGEPSKPEGYVTTKSGGRARKLVDRSGFSAANFAKGKPGKFGGVVESFLGKMFGKNPKTKVLSFGRMNPPTIGHEKLINAVKSKAAELGADHEIVLSHSQDPKKNPLSAEEKLGHARTMFPGTNFSTSSKEAPSFMHHIKRAADQGYKHLVIVVGSDRVPNIEHMANAYNGKEYHFHSIRVESAGERDEKAEGASGMSASKMRKHAAAGDFGSFRSGLPSHITHTQASSLFHAVRKGMGVK